MNKKLLQSIILKNFKCYTQKEFPLSQLTVFCGNNSVGKSTAIQALLLAMQNNFSSELEFTGHFLQLGSYSDIHNKDADEDSMSIGLNTPLGIVEWGYLDAEFDNNKQAEVEEAPLPLLTETSTEAALEWLKESYSSEFTFLCAERWGPRSNYPYSTQRRSQNWLGVNGEYTPQVLKQNLNFQLVADDIRIHEKALSPHLTNNLRAWMSEISPGIDIKPETFKDADMATNRFEFGGYTLRAANVGFGLSYVLPVVLSLLLSKPGGLVIIENPEAHLHPRGQSYLGRLIALAAEAGVQVIVETHSDHIMNGIRIMPRLAKVNPANIIFYQINDSVGDDKVKAITVNSQGQFSEWPEGFFDQQVIDMKILLSGREE